VLPITNAKFKANLPEEDMPEALKLAQLVRELNLKGHNPATSGNYSLRSKLYPSVSWVSESGIDKSLFTENHLLEVDQYTSNLLGKSKESGKKSSDETDLHLAVYRSTDANCVLHSHFMDSLLFCELYPNQEIIELTGLELLKGFKGFQTHEETLPIPCFNNTQDIKELSLRVEALLKNLKTWGVLLRGHGVYVWGESVSEAKRHLEVFEYIFRYFVARGGIK